MQNDKLLADLEKEFANRWRVLEKLDALIQHLKGPTEPSVTKTKAKPKVQRNDECLATGCKLTPVRDQCCKYHSGCFRTYKKRHARATPTSWARQYYPRPNATGRRKTPPAEQEDEMLVKRPPASLYQRKTGS